MSEINPEWEIGVEEVKRLIDAGSSLLLIDVREPHEQRTCRIEAARLIPLSDIQNRVEAIRQMAEDRPIVCHCHHGMRSLKAAAALRAAGIEGVRSMAGGIDAWSVLIDPKVPRY